MKARYPRNATGNRIARPPAHYNRRMRILIPGSLPPSSIAPELAAQVESSCPALVERLRRAQAQVHALRVDETGCTSLEADELQALGYEPSPTEMLGSGLGPLRAGIADPSERIWIAELSSVAIGREGATLLSPRTLDIRREESDALYEAVAPLWSGSGFSALPVDPVRWRIWLPDDAAPASISPQAVSGRPLEDWWPGGDTMRAWRRLANEIQMTWHAHPVNTAREASGLPPVNGVWLYGGGRGWRPRSPQAVLRVIDTLSEPFASGSWGDWVAALPALGAALQSVPPDARITLLGNERAVDLDTTRGRGWRRLLPGARDAWKKWWNLPD